MTKFKTLAILFISLTILSNSCSSNKESKTQVLSTSADSIDFSQMVEVDYAKKFKVVNHTHYKEIHIINPFGEDTIATYILALKQTKLENSITEKGTVLRVPIQSIVCLSATHVGALETLNLRHAIKGVTNINNYWDEEINKLITDGKIKEVGKGLNLNTEMIVNLSPDVITKNDHSRNNKEKELADININSVYYNDWRENHLLARTEWIKIMGLLFCKNALTDSIFHGIEKRYKEVEQLAKHANNIPSVLIAQDVKGTWYVPGSDSYIPSILKDAGAYTYAVEGVSTSIPTSFEQIYNKHYNDSFWLSLKGGTISSLEEFGSISDHYKKFKAFNLGNVYLNNKRVKQTGGNDFWETGSFKADTILKDLVKIFHPELLPNYETYYWQKLK